MYFCTVLLGGYCCYKVGKIDLYMVSPVHCHVPLDFRRTLKLKAIKCHRRQQQKVQCLILSKQSVKATFLLISYIPK